MSRLPLAVLAGLAAGLVLSAPGARAAARHALVESFGSRDCAACPDARAAVDLVADALGDENVVAVELHVAGPLATPAAVERRAYLGDPPEGSAVFVGTRLHVEPAPGSSRFTDYRTIVEEEIAVASPVALDPVVVFNTAAAAGSLTVEIEAEADVPDAPAWIVRAWITEDLVPACCDPEGGSAFSRVLREVLPPEPLAIGTAGEIQAVARAFPLDPVWTAVNLRALVFLQRDDDRSVLQSAWALDAGGLQPVPIPPGLDLSRVNLLPNRPNPVRTSTTIPFTVPRPMWVRMHLVNARGRIVRVLNDNPRPAGVNTIDWDGTDFAGGPIAAGVYVVRIETEEGVQSRKLTLVR